MQPPIRKAIERLDSRIYDMETASGSTDTVIHLKLERLFLETLLPAERETIERAFRGGEKDALKGEFGSWPEHPEAKGYYESRFCKLTP